MKICIWPDGFWCEAWGSEKRQAEQGRSDDYETVSVPDKVTDIDEFVAEHIKRQGAKPC